jgi:hypothetical protein
MPSPIADGDDDKDGMRTMGSARMGRAKPLRQSSRGAGGTYLRRQVAVLCSCVHLTAVSVSQTWSSGSLFP